MMKGGGYPFLLMVNADGTPQQQGQLVWGKRVEAHPAAMLTMSPTVHAGYIYQVRGSRTGGVLCIVNRSALALSF